jgi:tRNA(Ile)-lysidine synthase
LEIWKSGNLEISRFQISKFPHFQISKSGMTPLATRTLETVRRHALLRDGGRVLVALSGGADSVALLLILRELEAAGVLHVTGAAHLNHQLRGADADADEAFCAALAGRLGVRFIAERADVAALARAGKRSIEDAARAARHAFFERAADAFGADVVATAHTKDDQAETFLLRLLRGAGTRGLGGIRPRAGRVVRPLLEIDRAELRDDLTARGETWREDATNADVSIPRNRVRHELIPFLGSRFSSSVTGLLAREAALAQQDEDFLRDSAIELARRIVLTDERDVVRLDAAALAQAPRALGSRVVQRVLEQHAGSKSVSFDHIEQVLDLGPGQAVSLPGQDAVRTGDVLVFRTRRIGHRSSDIGSRTSFVVSLSIPGEVELATSRVAITAERLEGPSGRPRKWDARGTEVGVAAARLELPLAVRGRRPGDRFHPLGAPGPRKLQDFLVDRKIERGARDTVPLVVDGRDRIVWVVGQSVAEDFRVTDPAQGVILLKVRHLGGAG